MNSSDTLFSERQRYRTARSIGKSNAEWFFIKSAEQYTYKTDNPIRATHRTR